MEPRLEHVTRRQQPDEIRDEPLTTHDEIRDEPLTSHDAVTSWQWDECGGVRSPDRGLAELGMAVLAVGLTVPVPAWVPVRFRFRWYLARAECGEGGALDA